MAHGSSAGQFGPADSRAPDKCAAARLEGVGTNPTGSQKAPTDPAGGALSDVPTTGTSRLDPFEGVSDNKHRAKSSELTRIWRNPCEEEARSRYTSPTAVDHILEIV